MTTIASSCAVAPPLPGAQSPVQRPLQAGGLVAGASGAPAAPATQPGGRSGAADAATGGGALGQEPSAQASTSASTSAAAPDLATLLPVLEQLVATLTTVTATLGGSTASAQAQAGAEAATSGGGGAPAGDAGGAAGCCCGAATTRAAAGATAQAQPAPEAEAAPVAPPAPGAPGRQLDSPSLTVKGAAMSSDQRRNLQAVLEVGVDMGASPKVLEAAVSTVIQESTARNDSSVDSKDRDSLGLFQQRPSQGWGTREQISDPRYAARKFFERAIEKDRADPGLSHTRLAQSVQRSAHPDAYAKWDAEARQIVADFTG